MVEDKELDFRGFFYLLGAYDDAGLYLPCFTGGDYVGAGDSLVQLLLTYNR
jgi:hypothetical protein